MKSFESKTVKTLIIIPPNTHKVLFIAKAVALDRDLGKGVLGCHSVEFFSSFQQPELMGKLDSERPPQKIRDSLMKPINPALLFSGKFGKDVQMV